MIVDNIYFEDLVEFQKITYDVICGYYWSRKRKRKKKKEKDYSYSRRKKKSNEFSIKD